MAFLGPLTCSDCDIAPKSNLLFWCCTVTSSDCDVAGESLCEPFGSDVTATLQSLDVNGPLGSFIRTVNVTVFVSGTFALSNVMCKLHQMTALNPILIGTKTVTLTVLVNEPLRSPLR